MCANWVRPLLKARSPLIRNVLELLVESVLIPLGLIATISATDAAVHNKLLGSGACPSDFAKWTTLIISKGEINGTMERVKSLEESGLLIKSISETIKNEAEKNKKEDFSKRY